MQYYVYIYYDPISDIPRYVGKGSNNRDKSHWLRRTNHNNQLFREFLISLENQNLQPKIKRIKEGLSNFDAFLLEHQLIKQHGRLDFDKNGTLFNRSLGFEFAEQHYFESQSEIEQYFNSKHFNCVDLTADEIEEIIYLYRDKKFGVVNIAKMFCHGPNKIKKVLVDNAIPIRNRGGQIGKDNGMYGKTRVKNDFFKGKFHTDDSKLKISNSLKKPVTIDDVKYSSMKDAAYSLGFAYSTFKRLVKIGKIKIQKE